MKHIFLIWFSFVASFVSLSQTVTIINQETSEPIESAVLMSESPEVFSTTNAKGQVDISDFKNTTQIVVHSLGYKTTLTNYQDLSNSLKLAILPSSIDLDDVVISATRWSQVSGKVPSKITSISAKKVALQNPQTAADLLGVSGKVFIQKSQQGGGSPMIRGFATNRLLYAVDGIRMNTAIFRGGNIQNVISLDPFAIEHTEVLFGPGSVTYGSDAIGGVMSFQTLTPQLALDDEPLIAGKAVSRYSSANQEKTGHFDINVGWKKWAMITSINSNDYGDLKMGSHGPEEYLRQFYVQRIDSMDVVVTNDDPKIQRPSGYSQINMMQKIRFKPSNKWDFEYGFHYSETSDYARYDRHIRYKNGLPRYGEWNYGPQKWMMNHLKMTHAGNNKVYDQMTLRVAQQYFEESRVSRNMNKFDRETGTEQVDAYSTNLDFVKTHGKNRLFYGLESVINEVQSIGMTENISTGIKTSGPSRYPQSTWASYGIYLSNQYTLSDKLMLQTGIRYNQFQIKADFDTTFYAFPFTDANLNNGALTGSIGFVYRPTKKWVISANGATAFRSPNIDDIGKVFDSEPGSVVVPNPNLKAEYAYNADVSIAKIFSDKVKIDLTGYYTILKNALVRRDFKLNGEDSIFYEGTLSQVQAIQNAAVANVYGVQAGLEIMLPAGFRISSDFNYQTGTEELNDGTISPSRHAAPWFGDTELSYNAHKLNMKLYVRYCGQKSYEDLPVGERKKDYLYATDIEGNPYSPAWYTVNFKTMYNFAENFSISGGIENITDQRYRPYSSGMVASGRNFILSLRCNF